MSHHPIRNTPAFRKDDFVYEITSPVKRKNGFKNEDMMDNKDTSEDLRRVKAEESDEELSLQNAVY